MCSYNLFTRIGCIIKKSCYREKTTNIDIDINSTQKNIRRVGYELLYMYTFVLYYMYLYVAFTMMSS